MVRADDGELYRKHADDLVSLATTLVGHSAAADVVAAAVERTIGSAHWDQVDDRYAYWVRAVLNEARSSYRSAMRRARREEMVVRRDRPTAGAVEDDGRPDLLAAVTDLSLQQRTVVYLAYWRDLPNTEIAELLGVSDGTVRRQLARARSKLRRTLA
jgi:RNA polymerase sigma-70 factor (ECF subfamily)